MRIPIEYGTWEPTDMHCAPENAAFAALFRMIEARLSLPAVGIYEWGADGCRPWKASVALRKRLLIAGATDLAQAWQPISDAMAQALTSGETRRIDARELGLAGGFVAANAVASDGDQSYFLMIHDSRQRRLTPGMVMALSDGAQLLDAMLGGQGAAPQREPSRRDDSVPRVGLPRDLGAALRNLPTGQTTTLYMIDLDRFRSINEALGMAAGDALLAATGARLASAVEQGDEIIRLEGDRFAIVARTTSKDLRATARKLQEIVAQPHVLAGRMVTLQCSVGIVPVARGETNTRLLLLQADSAMRRAKAEGRNRSVLHEARFDVASTDKSQLELDLSNATGNGQMALAFQPFVDLQTGEVTGFEALLRWKHPTRGEVPPNVFIPLAESTGRILPLGIWTLETACRLAARWPRPLTLAVNISALQFHQPGFTAQVDAVLAKTGFPADRLELEITETVLMRDNPETITQLQALIDRGIRIALDDFGTGYSALAYLARLPHHRIKLDKTFVQDLTNPGTAELIRAIIAQARSSGICITAEGVERVEMLNQVRAMGFTHAQGYATGYPTDDPSQIFHPSHGPDSALGLRAPLTNVGANA